MNFLELGLILGLVLALVLVVGLGLLTTCSEWNCRPGSRRVDTAIIKIDSLLTEIKSKLKPRLSGTQCITRAVA